MKKRFLSFALTAAMTFGCCAGMPVTQAVDTESTFNPDDHLIKVSKDSYKIVSLNGAVTLNLFTNETSQWSYSVEKAGVVKTTETLALGNVDLDEKNVVDVADIMKIKSIIMTEQATDREMLVANANQDEAGKVDVADIMAMKNSIMSETSIGTVDITSTTTGEPEEWVEESTLGLVMDDVTYFRRASIQNIKVTQTDRTYDHYGNQSVLHDNGINVEVEFKQGRDIYYLDARVYDNGVGFRYRMPGEGTRTVSKELTTFNLRNDAKEAWYGVNSRNYEPRIALWDATATPTDTRETLDETNMNIPCYADKIVAPLTVTLADGKGYIAIQEANVDETYGGTNLYTIGAGQYQIGTSWNASGHDADRKLDGTFMTGWRMISLADNLNDLVNNYNVYHVNEAPDAEVYADTSWIEPGRSAWSWLTDYGATLKTKDAMYDFTMNASRLGFEYNVIDEGYRQFPGWGSNTQESNEILKDLGQYGEALGVKQVLWAYCEPTHNGFRMTNIEEAIDFLDFLVEADIHGAKIDFWPSEENADLQELQYNILTEAAKRKIVISYHGAVKPGGVDVTYPNELTREGIAGAEQMGASANNTTTTQSKWLTRQLYTRYLSGHADFTPCTDYAMNLASLVLIDSPMNVIATHPERILANPAVEFIKSVPTVWDQTVVLSNSVLGATSVHAKENDGNWFLGGIFGKDATDVNVDLGEFLGEGEYMMELWTDPADSTTMVKTEKVVTAEDVLELGSFALGKGFAARFSKIALNQYGGEILEPITITTADADAVVKYTIDGTDPATSATAKIYDGPITLTASCDLRAAIVEGDDAGAALKANFNLITAPFITESFETLDGKTVVTLEGQINSTLTYTTDGSDPLDSDTAKVYDSPITLTEHATVTAVCQSGGFKPLYEVYNVFVNTADADMVEPDQYLGADYLAAQAEWGEACVDQSMANDGSLISLGGTTADDGTKYEHGISANAVATYVYAVPEGATQFVGIVGIDDMAWKDGNGKLASATASVAFDGEEVFTTTVFTRGETYNIVADVPEGAGRITITFGDGGNGNTCDNVSMGNAGWIVAE